MTQVSNRIEELKAHLGDTLGSVEATRKKKNPYLAKSADGKNEAFGQTKEEALQNLITGIEKRNEQSN